MSDVISRLFEAAKPVSIAEGENLFHVGDPVERVHFVSTGCLGLRRVTETGTEMIMQAARAGQVLAEASVYSDAYHCDGVALEPSTCRALPRADFLALLGKDAEVQQAWARQLARGIQSARTRAEIRGLKTVAQRLDMWLSLNGPLPEKGGRSNLAAELGVSREALYREIARRDRQVRR
ncbi:MAG: Crp/Fnr family transcriptional regulator [Thalassovita sp.]|nr:Crp/Fnr family transcriptional regulator [Thalassovita sp.]